VSGDAVRRATGALLAGCLMALAGCRQPGFPAQYADSGFGKAGPAVQVAAPHGGYLGVYEPGGQQSYRPVAQFARAVGYQPRIVLYISRWGQPFPDGFVSQAHAHGAVPLIEIDPRGVSMAGIARGRYDGYLRWYARAVAGYGDPVIMGFARDMNGRWYPWGWTHTSPAVWVAAWRRLVAIFRQQYVPNVTWLWTIRTGGAGTSPLRAYWPGAAYVDWVGIDGYYITRAQTFQADFAPTVLAAREITHDPILLSETGIDQVADQERKIPDLFAGIRRYHLLGLVWCDGDGHTGHYHQDWQLEGDSAALAAFRRGIASMTSSGR
jgi:hypothetical protein